MSETEREASPERFPSSQSEEIEAPVREDVEPPTQAVEKTEITRQRSADSASSAPSSRIQRRPITVSRMPTQRDDIADLERHPTALSRIQTGRSQHSNTIAAGLRSRTTTRQSKTPMPNFGAGKPFPPPLPEREEYVVEFDGPNDPLHAQNWPLRKKMQVAITLGFVTLTAAFGSSIFSAAIGSVAENYGVSREVGILGVSLYVLGFATVSYTLADRRCSPVRCSHGVSEL